MNVFEKMSEGGHEEFIFCRDPDAGLKAIIAIHNTVLGPALGGCRMYPYPSFDEAMEDAARLSRGMTYKAAVAGLNLGGGKSVIIADPREIRNDPLKRELLFRSFGRFVQAAAGRYITAEDLGTGVEDMEFVNMETQNVTGIPPALGGGGDPSPVTAFGVFRGIQACVNRVFGSPSVKDLKIAVQGIGHVGCHLVGQLHEEGAKVYITDIDEEKTQEVSHAYPGVEPIKPEGLFELEAEVYAPCALGAVINDDTIDRLKFKIIAGAANNQLAIEQKHGQILLDKGIVYAPDYVINAGGLINVYTELEGYNREWAMAKTRNIFDAVTKVLGIAESEKIPTFLAANKMAEARISAIKSTKKFMIRP